MIERGLREEKLLVEGKRERERSVIEGEKGKAKIKEEERKRRKGYPALSARHREEGKRAGRIREGLCDRGITRGTGEAHGNKGTKGGTGSRVTPAGNDQRGKETLETVPP